MIVREWIVVGQGLYVRTRARARTALT
jgi:hypothetical protein